MLRRLVPLCLLAGGCVYARFQGSIPIAGDRTSLRVVGAFSPDGSQFAAAEGKLSPRRMETGVIRIWRRGPTPDLPGSWRLTDRVRLADLFVVDLAFSPDGRTLAVAGLGRNSNIFLWDLAKHRVFRTLRAAAPIVQSIAFGPRGEWLASAGVDGRVEVWDLRNGKLRARVQEKRALLRQSRFPLAVARDGSWLAYGRTDGRIAFADPMTGMLLGVRASGGRQIYDLAPSPDGRWLAVATDTGVRVWDLLRVASAPPILLSRERAPALAFFPDSRTLLAGGRRPGHSKVHEVPSGRVVYGFLRSGDNVENPPLGVSPPASGPREEEIWRRVHRTFPLAGEVEAVRSVVLGYLRFPTLHRVAISPENLWVAFFEGGRASLVITQDHYRLRTTGRPRPDPAPRRPVAGAI